MVSVMCSDVKPDRAVKLYEGHVRWIMNRSTPEERLAAWETIVAIAFPHDESQPYRPPEPHKDGSPLNSIESVCRDTYDIFSGLIRCQGKDGNGWYKDPKKVEAGRKGAAIRYGRSGASTVESTIEETALKNIESPEPESIETKVVKSPTPVQEDDFSGYEAGEFKYKRTLTKSELAAIKTWNEKIPNAEALKAYLAKNYLYQNRQVVLQDEFCAFAYHQLAKVSGWISSRDKRPFRDIRQAVHYIALDYIRKSGEIKRAEEEEKRKNMESAFETQKVELSKQSNTELASLERRRRRAAEKEAMEKIMKGEL